MLKPLEVLKLYPEHDYTLRGAFETERKRDRSARLLYAGKKPGRGREFGTAVAKTARLLAARGLRKGDRIGVLARNDVGHARCCCSAARGIGAIMVPGNPEFGGQEAGYVLKHAGVSAVACNEDVLPVVRKACEGHQSRSVVSSCSTGGPGMRRIFSTRSGAPENGAAPAAAAPTMPFSSSTLGHHRLYQGREHSQRNFVTAGESNISRLWLQPDERMMVVLPMFHVKRCSIRAGALAAWLLDAADGRAFRRRSSGTPRSNTA